MRFVALALLFPALAFAEPVTLTLEQYTQQNPKNLTADSELNAVYNKLLPSYGDPLKKSQRAWLGFIKLDCDAQLPLFGTSHYASINHDLCIYNHKVTRLNQLKSLENRI